MTNPLFAVLRLSTEITIDVTVGVRREVRIDNLEGFLPVFTTREEAEAASDGGRFRILELAVGEGNQPQSIIDRLEEQIVIFTEKIADVYNHNEAARAAVLQYFGTRHSGLVAEILERKGRR